MIIEVGGEGEGSPENVSRESPTLDGSGDASSCWLGDQISSEMPSGTVDTMVDRRPRLTRSRTVHSESHTNGALISSTNSSCARRAPSHGLSGRQSSTTMPPPTRSSRLVGVIARSGPDLFSGRRSAKIGPSGDGRLRSRCCQR